MVRLKRFYDNNKKGVTLIESMIAVSIVAFLAAYTVPSAVASIKEAKKVAQILNTRMLLASMDVYKKEELLSKEVLSMLQEKTGEIDLSSMNIEDIIKLSEVKNLDVIMANIK
jgi:prepilin-type N-terminal cleavage/methylation domain-containing protein